MPQHRYIVVHRDYSHGDAMLLYLAGASQQVGIHRFICNRRFNCLLTTTIFVHKMIQLL